MNVILGCDPLLSTLTGIGNYTLQLGLGLSSSEEVRNLRLFAHGRFFDSTLLQREEADKVNQGQANASWLSAIRTNLARSPTLVSIYSRIMPFIERAALKNDKDAIFHSPNFILPKYEGRKVVTIHDLSTLRFPEFHPPARVNLVNKSIEYAIDNHAHIITDSEFIKSEICDLYPVSSDRITAIHLGVDKQFFPRDEFACFKVLDKHSLCYKRFFLFVSTIEPRKNTLRLLEAFKQYRQARPEGLPLILIGGKGWSSEKEHELIKDLSSRGWVKYLGYVSQSQLPVFYAAAKALLFPSLYEGFGLPVAEALQSGTDVLTSQNSAMSEFSEGKALLVNPLNVSEIAEKVIFLSENSLQSEPAPIFCWSLTCEKTLTIYKNL